MIASRLLCLLVPAIVLLAACASPGGGGAARVTPSAPQPQVVLAAIGASDSVGIGAVDPTRDAWPQVFYKTALPESAVFYNFGIPGATVDEALSLEVPEALSVQPTLVTVWLNVNDIIAGVGAQQYQVELEQLVHAMRRGGAARVLLANTPYLDRLPAYLGCRAGNPPAGVDCPPALATTTSTDLNAIVGAYNAAIAQVAQREGAILVDLHAQGEVADAHPDQVSSDGFHPSTSGYAAIAALFETTLKRSA
jgi:acyl-CoA thioesterase I